MAQAPTVGTRIQALEILGALRLASPDAMTMITNALTDKDPQVRLAACKVIAQLSPRRARKPRGYSIMLLIASGLQCVTGNEIDN